MADLLLYDVIGEFYGEGQGAKWLAAELEKLDAAEPITLRINSPGGDVMEAVTMRELLADRSVDVKIDGLAASAASFLAASLGGEVTMADGGLYMIHNPWSIVIGEADDMRSEAEVLDKVRDNIAAAYAARGSLKLEQVLEAMEGETWYTAEEAKAAGLVDKVTGAAKAMKVPKSMGFKNTPLHAIGGSPKGGPSPKGRTPLAAEAFKRRLQIAHAELRS